MSTEWNNKLALSLRDPAEPALDLLPSTSIRSSLLGANVPTLPENDPHEAWLASGADRVPPALAGQAGAIDWTSSCEVSHPLTSERKSLGAVDGDALRAKASALAAEAAKRFDDPRRRWLWVWRFLSDRLASDLGANGAAAHLLPADPRMPDLDVWARIGMDGAFATASPGPTFLIAHLEPSLFDVTDPPSDRAYRAALRLHSHLAWQSALAVIDALGPDAVLAPSLRHHPLCDVWLAEQKVTASKGDTAPSAPAFSSFPSSFAALVPQARASELGEACVSRVQAAWKDIAADALKQLGKLGADTKDAALLALWKRQVEAAWQPGWVALPWLDDSTGAGGLLSKQEVSAHEKWVKVHQDASGLEDPWAGVYFGLWYLAARAASDARRSRLPGVTTIDAGPRCTTCGQCQALHAGDGDSKQSAQALWAAVTGSKGGAAVFGQDEQLCACCTVTRLWAGDTDAAMESMSGKAVVVFAPDQAAATRRGGKDSRQGATTAELLHSALSEPAAKARGALKEVLDTIPILGPSRFCSAESALATVALHTVPALVAEVGGTVLHAVAEEQIAIVPVDRALELVRRVRDRLREGFVEIDGRTATQPGSSATASAVIVVGESGTTMGRLVRAARGMLSVARDGLGGDALVLAVQGRSGGQQLLGLRASEVEPVIGTLLATFPKTRDWALVAASLRGIQPALVNPDVDKASADARAGLVRDALVRTGIRLNGDESAAEGDVARALCALVDRAMTQADGDVQRAMDGLHVAARFAGGDR